MQVITWPEGAYVTGHYVVYVEISRVRPDQQFLLMIAHELLRHPHLEGPPVRELALWPHQWQAVRQ